MSFIRSTPVPDVPSFDDTVKPTRALGAPAKLTAPPALDDAPPPFKPLDDDFDAYDAIAAAQMPLSADDDDDDDDDNAHTQTSIRLTHDADSDSELLEEVDLGALDDDDDDNDDDGNGNDNDLDNGDAPADDNAPVPLSDDDDDDDDDRVDGVTAATPPAKGSSRTAPGTDPTPKRPGVNTMKSKLGLEGIVKPGAFTPGAPSGSAAARARAQSAATAAAATPQVEEDDDDDVSPPPPEAEEGGDDDVPSGAQDLLSSIMGKAAPIAVEDAVKSEAGMKKWEQHQRALALQEAAAKKARDAEIAAKRRQVAQMQAQKNAALAAEKAAVDDDDDDDNQVAQEKAPQSAMDLISDIMSNKKAGQPLRTASGGGGGGAAEPKVAAYVPGGNRARDAKREEEAKLAVLPPVVAAVRKDTRGLSSSAAPAVGGGGSGDDKPKRVYSAFLASDADDAPPKLQSSASTPALQSRPMAQSNAPLPDDLRDPEEILQRFESADEKYAPCFKFDFAVVLRPPLLKIPDGSTFTAYDYTENRKTPFAFRALGDVALDPPDIVVSNPDADEPVRGALSPHAPLKALEKARKKLTFEAYEPRRPFPVLPPLEADVRQLDDLVRHSGLAAPRVDPTTIRSLEIVNVQLDKSHLKPIGSLLAAFTGLTHLTMRCCGFSKVLWAHAKLRLVDYSENNIDKEDNALESLSKSPLCEVLLMAGNPVCGGKSFASRAIAALPRLAKLDSTPIDVPTRLKALRAAGTSFQKKHIDLVHWDLRVCESEPVRAMREWQPAALVTLTLVDVGLTEFHVGALVGLRDLNLSKNAISSTLGCGLELPPKLRRVNLAGNRIVSTKMLEPFPLCASLLAVALRDNRDGAKELAGYRELLIYMTRYLAGSNRASGLQEVDGKPIAIKERVAAVAMFGKKKDLPAFAFETHVVNYIGRAQMRDANYVANIRELQLPSASLVEVSLRGMHQLEFLDLSGNHIVVLAALDECTRLRFVNLSGNADLDVKTTVATMVKALQRLEQLSLCVLAAGNKRHPDNAKYRQYVLTALLQRNRKLDWLDTRPVTVDERVAAYAASLGAKAAPHDADKYRFLCALVQNCTMPMMRRLHPSDVLGGTQFDAAQITILRQMGAHALRHVDFAPFVNLEELNLAGNQLTDVTKLGLDGLRKLRVLALHDNQLRNPLEQVAQWLDGFARLECVALRNNPCMRTPAERARLIGLMRSLHKARCSLRVLDTEISIKERVAAWAQLGGSAEATERLRFEAVMYQRLPPDVAPDKIESLDLTDAGMRAVDVAAYANLTCLLLNGNALTTLVGFGLESLVRLKVLDLRNNQLSNLVEVAKLVSNLARLATLGVAGNPWATRDKSGYRHALLQLLPQLSERECALKVIDEERLGADEIIEASKASKLVTTDKQLLRFKVLMLTRVPSGYRPSDLTELNLSKAQLDSVDLSACPLLVKLSLARNELRSLKTSNLHRLVRLRALDVSHNQLKDVSEFSSLLAALPRLAVLLWVQNPIAGAPNAAAPNAGAQKVHGAKALLPLSTLSKSQLEAREALFAKLAARRMGFNNVSDGDAASIAVVKTRAGLTIEVASLPLQVVDGRRVGIDELCEAMRADKRFKKDDIEEARLNVALRRAGANRATVRTLDLSNCGFSQSLEALRSLRSLQTLDLSNNQLTKLEVAWLAPLVELEELDLRNNKFASLKQLLQVLVQACAHLRVLRIENSTKNPKETAPSSDYPMKVCAALRQLQSCDGMANPYGIPAKTVKLARAGAASAGAGAAASPAKKATIRIQRAPAAPSPALAASAFNPEIAAGVRDLDDDAANDNDDGAPESFRYSGVDVGYLTLGLDAQY